MSDYEKMTGDKKISEIEDLVEIDGGEKVLVAFNGQNYVISVDRLINEGHLHSYQDLEDLQALLNIIDAQYQHIKDSTLPTTSKEISGSIKELYNLALRLVSSVPATKDATGSQGDVAIDSNYFYVCIQDNQWIRIALDTWE